MRWSENAADLAERVLGAHQIGGACRRGTARRVRSRPPRRRRRRRSRRASSLAVSVPREQRHHARAHRGHVLHVDGAAAPDAAVVRSRRRKRIVPSSSSASASTTSRWPFKSSGGISPVARVTRDEARASRVGLRRSRGSSPAARRNSATSSAAGRSLPGGLTVGMQIRSRRSATQASPPAVQSIRRKRRRARVPCSEKSRGMPRYSRNSRPQII